MSSYGSARSGHLQPGYQAPPHQQRARSYSNPPYPTTPGPAPYPQQQSGPFIPPPAIPYQPASTSNPIAIPASNRNRAPSDHAHDHGAAPSHPQSNPYANSYPTQYLHSIPQQQPIPENHQYSPPQQQNMMSSSPSYSHHRRRSSSSQYGYDPRQSYESAQSYRGYPSPEDNARHSQNGHENYDNHYSFGNAGGGYGQAHGAYGSQVPELPKGYGDWDKDEVAKYHKNQELERRPTLGGSLMSFVRKIGGSDRR